eukprot:TRINITY_DN690_c0_g1_i6.p1 TRINITY_DN690_c0_g1~~TRINITY_DN690_c0_g1_i6.p1  ORF type:complete len:228 (+),score=36.71 TRINITY_DN690_c0_g1_i6:106-789(+)
MESIPKVWGPLGNVDLNIVLVTASWCRVPIEENILSAGNPQNAKDVLEWGLGKKYPVFQWADVILNHTNAIVKYIATTSTIGMLYHGRSIYDLGLIDQWLDFAISEVEPNLKVILDDLFGWERATRDAKNKAYEALNKAFNVLDAQLAHRKALVGETASLADVVLGSYVIQAYRTIIDEAGRAKLPNLSGWVYQLATNENFTRHLGNVKFCQRSLAEIPRGKSKGNQ